MRIEYDSTADAAYIYLTKIGPGGVKRTYPCNPAEAGVELNLDFDSEDKLIGIELFFGARKHLPKSLGTCSVTVELHRRSDVAYIHLTKTRDPKVKRTYHCNPAEAGIELNLDFDSEDRLIGIKVLNASMRLPKKVLEKAKVIQ